MICNVFARSAVCAALIMPLLVGLTTASASTISVNSPSFENPGPATTGDWSQLDPAWSYAGPIPFSQNNGDNITADDGLWSVFLGNTGTISQNLSTFVMSGATLSVTFSSGKAKTTSTVNDGGIIRAIFDVNGTLYTQDFDSTSLANNTWTQFTLTKLISNSGNLTLRFSPISGEPWLDTISEVTHTPEPASAALFATGLAALVCFRRNRQ